jgi:hypothetical protein
MRIRVVHGQPFGLGDRVPVAVSSDPGYRPKTSLWVEAADFKDKG